MIPRLFSPSKDRTAGSVWALIMDMPRTGCLLDRRRANALPVPSPSSRATTFGLWSSTTGRIPKEVLTHLALAAYPAASALLLLDLPDTTYTPSIARLRAAQKYMVECHSLTAPARPSTWTRRTARVASSVTFNTIFRNLGLILLARDFRFPLSVSATPIPTGRRLERSLHGLPLLGV